jgi:hypothetical protein
MSIIQKTGGGAAGTATVDSKGQTRVSRYPPEIITAYQVGAVSGLLTLVATAGHIFAFRAPASGLALVTRIRVRVRTIAGFTAAQEFAIALYKLTGYTVAHTGGTPINVADVVKLRESYANPTYADARIATTTGLTAGTHTLDAQPFAWDAYAELAAAATVAKGRIDIDWGSDENADHPLVLAPNEGFIVRNEVLMGAAGTARLHVNFGVLELASW